MNKLATRVCTNMTINKTHSLDRQDKKECSINNLKCNWITLYLYTHIFLFTLFTFYNTTKSPTLKTLRKK